jgi:hypothetical protein
MAHFLLFRVKGIQKMAKKLFDTPGLKFPKKHKLGEVLVKEGLITRQQLNLALERQVVFGGRIGTNLIELRILTEEEFKNFLSKYYRLRAVTNEMIASLSDEAMHALDQELIDTQKIIPLMIEGKRLHCAFLDPDIEKIDELRFITGFDIIPYAIPEMRFLDILERYYGKKTGKRSFISLVDRFNPRVEALETGESIKKAFSSVDNPEEVVDILLRGTFRIVERVAVFRIWDGNIKFWKAKGLCVEEFEIAKEESSIFSEVIEKKMFYRGPVHEPQLNEPLIEILSGIPWDILVMPLTVRDKVIALLYCDNGNDAVLDASIVSLSKIASMASLAFEIITLKEKVAEIPF